MLKGISKYISPELLAVLHEMGHGDEIILADAHFPGHSIGLRVIRADGIPIQGSDTDRVAEVGWSHTIRLSGASRFTFRRYLAGAISEAMA